MSDGDVRANYVQTAGIWTSTPAATADEPVPNMSRFTSSALRGSLAAFNATMETYKKGNSCHQQLSDAPNSFQPFQLLLIYSQIAPLMPGSP